MTEKIYDKDPHILEFTATVISCEIAEGKLAGKVPEGSEAYAVILDRTAFFPEEGGQGSDKGTIEGHPVLHVAIDKENTLTHLLPCALIVGSTVTGKVDWAQRFDYMQQHTGEHLLSGMVNKHFGYDNTGFHLGADTTTLDFNGPITLEEIRKMEQLVNEAIQKDIPVKTYFPSKEELATLQYRSKIELTGDVRIVEISDVDICACCAPHVDSTGQVGMLKVTDIQTHRGGVRINILCGMRALLDYTAKQEMTSALSALLSAKPELIVDATVRLKEEVLAKQERINELQAKLLAIKLDSLPAPDANGNAAPGTAILFEEPMDTKAIRNAVNALVERYNGYCAIFTGSDEAGYNFILGSKDKDCNLAAKAFREQLSSKCGGSPVMIQGSTTAKKEEILNLIHSF